MSELGQFIRAETHPLTRSSLSGKGKGRGQGRKGWNARDIRNEQERRLGAIPHIEKPEPPIVLFGLTPTKVLERISKEIAGRKSLLLTANAGGAKIRRIRRDQHVKISGVVGYPIDWKGVKKGLTETDTYVAWKTDVIGFLKGHYAKAGGELVSVIEHTDEPFPHLHFDILPVASPTFAAREIHDGWRLKLEARKEHQGKTEENVAYKRGNEILLDAFYFAVSQKYGHARHKGKRPRVARKIYASEKRRLARENQLLAESRKFVDQKERLLDQKADKLESQQRVLLRAKDELAAQASTNVQRQTSLDRRELNLRQQEGELAKARTQFEASKRTLVQERKRAALAEAAYLETIKDILPRVEETLSDIKSSIVRMAKTRDRYRNPQNPAEVESFSVSRSMVEILEQTALKLDMFISIKSHAQLPQHEASDLESQVLPDDLRPMRREP